MPQNRTHIRPGQKLELDLTAVERKAMLEGMLCLPPEYESLLRKTDPKEPLLLSLDDLDDFSGYVAAELNHTNDKKLRRILDAAFKKMTALLDRFTDEEPPVSRPQPATPPTKSKKPTARSASAQKAFEQWRAAAADQATFLVAWASTALRLADQRKNRHEILASFVPNELDQVVLATLPGIEPAIADRLVAGTSDFTRGEVGGMVMAIAKELVKAPAHQQVGMLLTAMSLIAAMEAKPGEPPPHVVVKKVRPPAKRATRAKKTTSTKTGRKRTPRA